MRKILAIVLIFVGIFSTAAPVFACEPPPPPPPQNPDCNTLGAGYQFGLAIRYARNGTYTFVQATNRWLIGGAPQDRQNAVTISNSNLHAFDWRATMGIDAIIVKAGNQTTVRRLNEEASGANVFGALDRYGHPYKIDKVEFCYDYELAVTVEAVGTAAGGPAAWEISKSAAVPEKAAFAGERAVFDYTVAVQKVAGGDSSYSVQTVVKVRNNTPLTARLEWGSARVNPGNIDILNGSTIECGDIALTFPIRLAARSELNCTVTTPLDHQLNGAVTVSVHTSGYVGGGSATAEIAWNGTTPGTGGGGFDTVTVTDTNAAFGGPQVATDSHTWTYQVELACPTDPAAYANGPQTTTLPNTAAITETGQSASQTVTLRCYAPTVSTSASANYDVQYTWGIDKNTETTAVELDINQTVDVAYTVTLTAVGAPLPGGTVAGQVTIGNTRPDAAMVVGLVDEIAPGVPVTFTDCTSPVTVPAGGSATCNFNTTVAALPAGENSAQVTLNGILFTATAPFTGGVGNEIDEMVTVTDIRVAEPLGTVNANAAPHTFNYSLTIGPYPEADACRETSFLNSASFVTNDTGTEGYDNNFLPVKVKCVIVTNCVRPISYWVSHADPADTANYNPAWNMVQPSGPSSPFYTTGLTWLEVLGRSASSATYYRLATAYIAAKLNTYFGAIPNAAVTAAIATSETLLETYASNQAGITGDVTTAFRTATTTLSNFNRGAAGNSVCPDCQN